jgi:hypothetical protein
VGLLNIQAYDLANHFDAVMVSIEVGKVGEVIRIESNRELGQSLND